MIIGIIGQTSNNVSDTLSSATDTLPYLGVFTIIVILVKELLKRSQVTDLASANAVLKAEEKFKAQIQEAIRESEENCNARLEAEAAKCSAEIQKMQTKMTMVETGLELISTKYPDDQTLQLLMKSLKALDEKER